MEKKNKYRQISNGFYYPWEIEKNKSGSLAPGGFFRVEGGLARSTKGRACKRRGGGRRMEGSGRRGEKFSKECKICNEKFTIFL